MGCDPMGHFFFFFFYSIERFGAEFVLLCYSNKHWKPMGKEKRKSRNVHFIVQLVNKTTWAVMILAIFLAFQ